MRKARDYRNKGKLKALYGSYSIREIASLYGVSGNAIWEWLKRFGIEARVEDRRALEMIQDLKKVGLSFAGIAQLTGIHVSQVYRIKRGYNKRPNFSTVRKFTKLHNKVCKNCKNHGDFKTKNRS